MGSFFVVHGLAQGSLKGYGRYHGYTNGRVCCPKVSSMGTLIAMGFTMEHTISWTMAEFIVCPVNCLWSALAMWSTGRSWHSHVVSLPLYSWISLFTYFSRIFLFYSSIWAGIEGAEAARVAKHPGLHIFGSTCPNCPPRTKKFRLAEHQRNPKSNRWYWVRLPTKARPMVVVLVLSLRADILPTF